MASLGGLYLSVTYPELLGEWCAVGRVMPDGFFASREIAGGVGDVGTWHWLQGMPAAADPEDDLQVRRSVAVIDNHGPKTSCYLRYSLLIANHQLLT